MIIALDVLGAKELAMNYVVNNLPPMDYRMLLLSFAVAALSVGTTAMIFVITRDWLKGRREKIDMITKDRNDREHAVLLEVLTDGILDRQVKGELSGQTARRMLHDVAVKMELLDLLPKKKIAELVKASLKGDKERREVQRSLGLYVEHPLGTSAGDPPTPITTVKKSSFKTMGRAVRFLGQKTA